MYPVVVVVLYRGLRLVSVFLVWIEVGGSGFCGREGRKGSVTVEGLGLTL